MSSSFEGFITYADHHHNHIETVHTATVVHEEQICNLNSVS